MNNQNPMNPFGGPTSLVDSRFGNAYPKVEAVYAELERIIYLADNLATLYPREVEFRSNYETMMTEWRYVGTDTWVPWFSFDDWFGESAEDLLAELNQIKADVIAANGTAQAAATNAQASATAAATSEGNASASAGAAATSATNAGNSATSAGTSATNASNSATAANTAKTGAETARDESVTAKTASETARDAAVAAKTAAETARDTANTAATNASGSATTASTAAGTATTKAGEAATSATNASNSATAAGTSATNAAASLAAMVVLGAVKRLYAASISTTTVSIGWDKLWLPANGVDPAVVDGARTVTLNLATQGLNGRDQAGNFVGQWVNLFAVYNGTTFGVVASSGATPTGYTRFHYLGCIRVGGVANQHVSFICRGARFQYIGNTQTLHSTSITMTNGGGDSVLLDQFGVYIPPAALTFDFATVFSGAATGGNFQLLTEIRDSSGNALDSFADYLNGLSVATAPALKRWKGENVINADNTLRFVTVAGCVYGSCSATPYARSYTVANGSM